MSKFCYQNLIHKSNFFILIFPSLTDRWTPPVGVFFLLPPSPIALSPLPLELSLRHCPLSLLSPSSPSHLSSPFPFYSTASLHCPFLLPLSAGGGAQERGAESLPHARGERRRGVEEATTHAANGDEARGEVTGRRSARSSSPENRVACRRRFGPNASSARKWLRKTAAVL